MRKVSSISIAAAMAAFAGHAAAQTNVEIYGIADVGVEYQNLGAGSKGAAVSKTIVATGTSAANRLGFRGTEDLGGGTKAFFVLEGGFNVDDGAMVPAGVMFNRRAHVGISGKWGDIMLGRDFTPAFWSLADVDFTRSGLYGMPGTADQITALGYIRQSNGIYYASPVMNGFRVRAMVTTGAESTTEPTDAGRMVAASAHYTTNKYAASVFYMTQRVVYPAASTTSAQATYAGISAMYNFDKFKLSGALARYSPAGPDTATSGTLNSGWIGVQVPIGADTFHVGLGRTEMSLTGPEKGKTMLYGVNYIHNMSKSTALYAGIGRIDNNAYAQLNLEAGQRTIAGNGLGSGTTAITMGIRKNF